MGKGGLGVASTLCSLRIPGSLTIPGPAIGTSLDKCGERVAQKQDGVASATARQFYTKGPRHGCTASNILRLKQASCVASSAPADRELQPQRWWVFLLQSDSHQERSCRGCLSPCPSPRGPPTPSHLHLPCLKPAWCCRGSLGETPGTSGQMSANAKSTSKMGEPSLK